MSETDDTDELILIPPDFFITEDLEEPYLSGPYYNVVDSLISQVNLLESRLNLIETKSEVSGTIAGNSLDSPDTKRQADFMSGIRKYNSSDDINKVTRDGYFESTQSTPQKPQTRFKLSSCSSTGTGTAERYSPRKRNAFSPNKFKVNVGKSEVKNEGTKEILQEIDQYIYNIQSSKDQKYAAKSDSSSRNSLNLKDLEHMLRKVDLQTRQFEVQNLPKENGIVPGFQYERQVRERNGNPHPPSASDVSTYNESYNEKTDSISSSSESTQMTALPNVHRLHAGGDYNYGQIQPDQSQIQMSHQSYVRQPENRAKRNILHDQMKQDRRLLSLSHLWNRGDDQQEFITREERILQKLEEEKLRRQHCEQLIQHLQSRTLELQEKLAVAMQVDETKDDAILKFHSSWEQVAERLRILTKDRNDLENEVARMQAQNAENLLESTKKINHFENESSKALSLAKTGQDKVKELESQISSMTAEMHSLRVKIEQLEGDCRSEMDKNKNFLDEIEQKRNELTETHSSLGMVRGEVANSKRAIETCQRELTAVRSQNSHLEALLAEKNDVIQSMERHNQKLLSEIDSHKKVEKDLQQELNRTKEMSEKNKTDLRNFYQDQVEIVVREKLKEFQLQLDKAETSLQEDLRKRELTIAKSAAGHIQQIADKHALEIRLLEEKHAEEVRLYQMKLSQSHQHVESIQSKLNFQYQRKSDMAKQLHRVMEAQWLEALKIINNGRSPVQTNEQDVTINQLNVLKTKSHSNLEEVLSMDTSDEGRGKPKDAAIIPPLNLGGASGSSMQGDNNYENFPYSLNMDTPLSSRPKTKQQIEMELQKYVQLLLNKQPGNPVDEMNAKHTENFSQEIPTWQAVGQDEKPRGRDRKLKKPWR